MIICLPVAFLGVGSSELLLVLAVAFILLGPKELPRIARTLGKVAARFRSASDQFRSEIMDMDDSPVKKEPGSNTSESRDMDPVGRVVDTRSKDADNELTG